MNVTGQWVVGLLLVPLVTWGFWVTARLNYLKVKADKLEYMHNHPDRYGFGTKALTRQTLKLSHWMKSSAYWTRWAAEEATGKKAPPVPPDDDNLNSEDTLTPQEMEAYDD